MPSVSSGRRPSYVDVPLLTSKQAMEVAGMIKWNCRLSVDSHWDTVVIRHDVLPVPHRIGHHQMLKDCVLQTRFSEVLKRSLQLTRVFTVS